MGKITGFLEINRYDRPSKPVSERIHHYREFMIPLSETVTREQASRCMNCGIPYCHEGCPVHNQIPDWNDLVYSGDWFAAARDLHSTNNFPEITGRICPAPCEAACTLNLIDQPVTIKTIEAAIADRAWAEGWVQPEISTTHTDKQIAIIGSGPAGLACAQQLARAGHAVHVYEKNEAPGGLLRYGIPDFKLEKSVLDRRIAQMESEGVIFHCGKHIGITHPFEDLHAHYDAVVLAGGAEKPRDLLIPGRELQGIHWAMTFLTQQNRRLAERERISLSERNTSSSSLSKKDSPILAYGKHVIVIGGGDTGSDCIGTSIRQGALSVTQLEIMSEPPVKENKLLTWPHWPFKLRTSSSQEEGAERFFSIQTVAFKGKAGIVKGLECRKINEKFEPLPEPPLYLPADLILLAMGFVSPLQEELLDKIGLIYDSRGNVLADTKTYQASREKVFACGDMRRGQSLVVWAIREGRQCAEAVDSYLMKASHLSN